MAVSAAGLQPQTHSPLIMLVCLFLPLALSLFLQTDSLLPGHSGAHHVPGPFREGAATWHSPSVPRIPPQPAGSVLCSASRVQPLLVWMLFAAGSSHWDEQSES